MNNFVNVKSHCQFFSVYGNPLAAMLSRVNFESGWHPLLRWMNILKHRNPVPAERQEKPEIVLVGEKHSMRCNKLSFDRRLPNVLPVRQ